MKPITAPRAAALLAALSVPALSLAARAQDFPSPTTGQSIPPGTSATADPNAARMVHLQWEAPPATAFANVLTVDESVPGSFFMACGFAGGYFGLQQMPNKSKVATFSVWDELGGAGGAAPQPVEVLATGDGVQVTRFGDQAAGARMSWPFAWKEGRSYTMLVRVLPDADKVIYSAYMAGPSIQNWKLMASVRTRAASPYLQGLYSFVEDFRRDGKSLKQLRRARFSQGFVQTPSQEWVSVTQARFGADSNAQPNINASIESRQDGPARQQFFTLATGGQTRQSTPLGARLQTAPIKLPN